MKTLTGILMAEMTYIIIAMQGYETLIVGCLCLAWMMERTERRP